MEQNRCPRRYAVHDMDDKQLLKRNDACFDQPQTCHFACNDDLNVGFLYEIDHKRLPPKYPIQLKAIRVVMLAEKNGLYVSVRFPSTRALRTYFSSLQSRGVAEKKYPDLDEQFVMGLKSANVVLVRKILPPEFQEHGRLQSFWLLPQKVAENSSSVIDENSRGESSVIGKGNSSLNCDGLLNWGVRRRITFKLKTPRVPSMFSLIREQKEAKMAIEIKDEAAQSASRKRKRGSFKNKKKSKTVKPSTDQEEKFVTKIHNQKVKLSYNRWSQERYKNAEVKMLEIMKEKGAAIGKPISRPVLRLEARKHIGDTGLLDHLLKHMAGKVAPNGEDRFCRRHNADGAMEYWLESAELINIRKEAGVDDPFWSPPLGWKPGDSLCLSQDPNSARELTVLREEMDIMRRDMQELLLWKREHSNVDKAIEQHLLQISTSIKLIEEEVRKQALEGANSKAQVMEAIGENDKMEINEEEKKAEKAAKIERLKSGFRLCRPQGTFLWPNMGGSCSSTVNNNSLFSNAQMLVQDGTVIAASESLVLIHTPPSVTSATTTSLPIARSPPPLPAPTHSTIPVKPLPEKRLTVVTDLTRSSLSTTCEQGDNMDMSTLILKENQNGFCETPTSYSTYPRTTTPLMVPSATMSGGEAISTKKTERTYRRKLAMQV